ncbi:MAG: CpsD/CapB family tyrosine-protein kinase [Nitrospirae bacterium]|nr:MAG: CpsD/CapB family tyrosine-protein kinase [Nitrospirota bacterium]
MNRWFGCWVAAGPERGKASPRPFAGPMASQDKERNRSLESLDEAQHVRSLLELEMGSRGPDKPVQRKVGKRSAPDAHLVSLLAPTSVEAEQYRTLATAINLAGAMAQSHDARVLLVDADLRLPSVASQLGMAESEVPGFADAIMNPEYALKDVVRECPGFHLAVLPAGRCPLLPDEVFKSARVRELLDEARTSYDYIVLDTPPVVLVPDCRMIEKWVDGFLMVIAAHKTPQKLVEEALNIMNPAKLVGLVLNHDDHLISHYYGYYSAYSQQQEQRQQRLKQRLTKS